MSRLVPRRDGAPLLVGVAHLAPLPGAPRPGPPLDEVVARSRADVTALVQGGCDAVIVENLGDAPFAAEQVPPVTVAAMTRVALALRDDHPELVLGLNVLRNDALAALAVAHVVGAAFLRVNVLTGVMATDQGLVQGRARELLQARRAWGAQVAIVADVLVKHAQPVGTPRIEDVAHDTFHRGGADVIVVSGTGTGRPTDIDDLRRVRGAVPDAPLWLGSGLTPDDAPGVRHLVDGAVVGTWLHRDAALDAPIDPARVARMRAALDG